MAVTRASRKGPPAARPLPAPAIRVESGEIFYDSGSTVIEYVHGDTPARCLAICFSPDDHIDVRSVGYQQQSLRKAGFDVLAVKQAAVPGYADLTPASIAEILAKLPAYEGVVALGAESGAFAALRLLGQFDGLPIVALSPRLHGKPGPAEAIKANAYVAFDPKTKAGRASCRDVIAQYPRVRLLRLHSAGDSVRLALEEADMLPPMLDALASRTPIDPAAYFRANRAKSPIILYYMAAHATKRRHFHAARSLMARAVAIDDQGPIALAYSRALADSGDLPRAVVEIDKLLAREPNVSHHWAAKSYIHELAGDDPAALDAIRHAIELEPDFEHFRVPERRLLDRLYSEMAKRNQMTIAALEKARGELNMKRGFVESDAFDARGMAGLIVFSLLIVGLVATLAITFRLI